MNPEQLIDERRRFGKTKAELSGVVRSAVPQLEDIATDGLAAFVHRVPWHEKIRHPYLYFQERRKYSQAARHGKAALALVNEARYLSRLGNPVTESGEPEMVPVQLAVSEGTVDEPASSEGDPSLQSSEPLSPQSGSDQLPDRHPSSSS